MFPLPPRTLPSFAPQLAIRAILHILDHSLPMLANWRRYGVTTDLHVSNLLETAPYFLRLVEERRLVLAEQEDIEPAYSRQQAISVVLMKTLQNGATHYLYSWDAAAEQ